MDAKPSFSDLLSTNSLQISFPEFFGGLVLAIVLSFILSKIFIHYADTVANRRNIARNFIPLTLITMLVISVVKSSLSLSLGLVGALSIVRFRAAIKEPEELVYLFFAIGIGLGCGANQGYITAMTVLIFGVFIFLRKRLQDKKKNTSANFFVTLSSENKNDITINDLVNAVNSFSTYSDLKRFDESENALEATFATEFTSYDELNKLKKFIHERNPTVRFTFLENVAINR